MSRKYSVDIATVRHFVERKSYLSNVFPAFCDSSSSEQLTAKLVNPFLL